MYWLKKITIKIEKKTHKNYNRIDKKTPKRFKNKA